MPRVSASSKLNSGRGSNVDSGGVWTLFLLLRFDLRIKNLFSSPASLPSGKNGKIECIKAFSTILVSFLSTKKKDCTLKCHFSRDRFESADACAGWLEEESFSKTKFPFEILSSVNYLKDLIKTPLTLFAIVLLVFLILK